MKRKRASDFHEAKSDDDASEGGVIGDGSPSDAASDVSGGSDRGPGNGLHRLPTNAELKAYRDAVGLYKSPLFKLQLDELLVSVTPNYSKLGSLEETLRKVKTILDKPMKALSLSLQEATAWAARHEVCIPFTDSLPDSTARYQFVVGSPATVAIVGSFLIHQVSRASALPNVDVAVEMPPTMFQEKDFINNRYFHKKAFFLACLAAHIRNSFKGTDSTGGLQMSFHVLNGDMKKPVLLLQDEGTKAAKMTIRLHPVVAPTAFSLPALGPRRRNLRKGPTEDPVSPAASSHYNNAILSDMFLVSHLNVLHLQRKACPAMDAAAVMGRTWLSSRGLSDDALGFTGFMWSMLLDFLLRGGGSADGKVPGANASAYQLFRVGLEFLAEHDFRSNPVFMTDRFQPLDDNEFSRSAFLEVFEVVMVDPSGMVNLAAHMTASSLAELQREAKWAVCLLGDESKDHFGDLFLSRSGSTMMGKYDEVFSFPCPAPKIKDDLGEAVEAAKQARALSGAAPSVLLKALRHRSPLIVARQVKALAQWPTNSEWTSTNDPAAQRIVIGCSLATEHVGLVDHGPAPEDQEDARAFTRLWGELAELRRFKDGRIRYSVVWEAPKHPDSGSAGGEGWILRRAVPHLLRRQFGLENVVSHEAAIDAAFRSRYEAISPPEAVDLLSKRLRILENLPLSILSVARASTGLFGCDPSLQMSPPSGQLPSEVVLELEHSNRWPDDLEALQKMKLAFLLRIADQLRVQHPEWGTVVGGYGEDDLEESLDLGKVWPAGYLDVSVRNGIAFRCRLKVDHELHLLERALASPASPQEVKAVMRSAKDRFEALHLRAPYHALHLHNRCLEFPGLSWTIRLTKYWLACHLLSLQFADELLDLICLSVFTNPRAAPTPGGGSAGFVRVLDVLATWDWPSEPLIVELHKGSMTTSDRQEIESEFRAFRSNPANSLRAAMFVATEADRTGRSRSYGAPSPVIVDRVRQLARSGLSLLDSLAQSESLSIKVLFQPDLKDYDVVLHLECADAGSPDSGKRFKNIELARQQSGASIAAPKPAFRYCQDLQRAYGEVALFFANKYDPKLVAVLWNPRVMREQPFRVSIPFPCDIRAGEDVVGSAGSKASATPDRGALVAEMLRIGNRVSIRASIAQRAAIASRDAKVR
ncbi:Nrap protein [Hyaloraphidium curvatum]|nr:Nrap protein [Hyaloraphidium curvatum]